MVSDPHELFISSSRESITEKSGVAVERIQCETLSVSAGLFQSSAALPGALLFTVFGWVHTFLLYWPVWEFRIPACSLIPGREETKSLFRDLKIEVSVCTAENYRLRYSSFLEGFS